MTADPLSALIGAIVGRAAGAVGMRGGVSFGNTLGRAISSAAGTADYGGGSRGGQGGGDGGDEGARLPDEVKSLLKQPLHILLPNLPKTAYQPVLQGGQYFATNERGENVGEGFKNVLDALKHMDDLILAQRAQFISAKTGVPLTVNDAGEIVRAAVAKSGGSGPGGEFRGFAGFLQALMGSVRGGGGGDESARHGAGGDGESTMPAGQGSGFGGGLGNLVAMLVRSGGTAGRAAGAAGAAAGGAGAGGAGVAGAAAAGGAGAAGGGAAAGGAALAALVNPATAVAAALVGIGAAAAIAPFAIKNWTESLLQSREELRQFNGQIGIAFAQFEREEILRRRQFADSTAGSTSTLVEAVSGLKDEFRPLSEAATTIINLLGTFLAHLARIEVAAVSADYRIKLGLEFLGFIEGKLGQNAPTNMTFLDDLARGRYTGYDKTRRRKMARRATPAAGGNP